MKIKYEDERVAAEIEVERATVGMMLARMRMMTEAEDMEFPDPHTEIMRAVQYSGLVASTPTGKLVIDGAEAAWPPDWDSFLNLPVEFVDRWYAAAEQTNPHWFTLPEIDPKKVSTASKES